MIFWSKFKRPLKEHLEHLSPPRGLVGLEHGPRIEDILFITTSALLSLRSRCFDF